LRAEPLREALVLLASARRSSARTSCSLRIECQPETPFLLANWARSLDDRSRSDAAVINGLFLPRESTRLRLARASLWREEIDGLSVVPDWPVTLQTHPAFRSG
jgi:hypothetical protein